MDTLFFLIAIIVTIAAGLVGTLLVAKDPEDKNYGSVTKRIRNLSAIYLVVTIISLVGFILYLFA